MSLFDSGDRGFAEHFSRLVLSNPFLPEWTERERELLGADYISGPKVYAWQPGWDFYHMHPNLTRLTDRSRQMVAQCRERLCAGQSATPQELTLYEDLALYALYEDSARPLDEYLIAPTESRRPQQLRGVWRTFQQQFAHSFDSTGQTFPTGNTASHLFACYFQIRRAMYHIFHNIVGMSPSAARLRGAVWQSILTRDIRRWHRSLYSRMKDFPTLITGPSGTGKELVAQAIGRSQFIPFDEAREQWLADFGETFYPLSVSALAPTLVEAELFGHARGAFTGAASERAGWLEKCGEHGAVFLDEIGELDPVLQVKLLRVLQARRFVRLGETTDRLFAGKILAATNRDLAREVHAGRFREDFYYRLCADRITTPCLHEQLRDCPEDLLAMVQFIARRVVGPEEGDALAKEVVDWIERHLGNHYAWPGNFRELEQCVRSYAIRQDYQPLRPVTGTDPREQLAAAVVQGALTAGELESRYFTLVYLDANENLQEAARRLQCDWRTLRNKLDAPFLQQLRQH